MPDLVEIRRGGRVVAYTRYDRDDRALAERVAPPGHQASRNADPECEHKKRVRAFAYVPSLDMHWPIEHCAGCLEIVAGRRPYVSRRNVPAWGYDVADVIIDKWRGDWPSWGKPRGSPPASTAWPDGV